MSINYTRWIVLLYLIVFQIFFTYINLKTRKKIGLPVKAKSNEVKIAVILGGVIFTVVILSLFVPSFYNVVVPIPFLQSELLTILGCILLFVSLVVGVSSALELGTSWRVGILEEQKTELVQTGIYRFCRNPYFLSYYIMFLAFFLIISSVVLLFLNIAAVFGFHYQIVKNEEKHLERVHGIEYVDYCKRVDRYSPKIKRGIQ